MLISTLLVLSVLSAKPAFADPKTCADRVKEACDSIRNGPKGVIRRNPDGTIEFNPNTNIGEWPREDRRYLQIENVNRQNFENRIKPVFEGLKAVYLEKLQEMRSRPRNEQPAYLDPMFRRLMKLTLVVNTDRGARARCFRPDRPAVGASFDHESKVLICPVMTHLDPSALVTVLAHELGHAVDLCEDEIPGVDHKRMLLAESCESFSNNMVRNFSFRFIHCCSIAAQDHPERGFFINRSRDVLTCGRNNEIYADYIAAYMTEEFMKRQGNVQRRLVNFPEDMHRRVLAYGFYRMDSGCQPNSPYYEFFRPLFQTNYAKELLSCAGAGGDTACTDEQVAPPAGTRILELPSIRR